MLEAVDTERFDPLPIGITKDGNWHHYLGTYSAIAAGTWVDDPMLLRPAAFSPSRGAPGFGNSNGKWMPRRIDLAFPRAAWEERRGRHGAGAFELSGILLVGAARSPRRSAWTRTAPTSSSPLAGIAVPKSVVLEKNTTAARQKILDTLSLPGVRKARARGLVLRRDARGIARCAWHRRRCALFRYDSSVIVEEAVPGFEESLAVLGTDT